MSATRRRLLMAIFAGAFPSLDTAVNVAFPSIDEHYALDVADLQWIVISYLLTYGALLVAAGRIGDLIGFRRLMWWGSVVSAIGLAGCAAAPTFGTFLVSRVVQGIGTALVLAGAPALLTTSANASGRAVGIFQTATMVGLTIGPAMGGPLVEFLGWRSVYWVRIPIALALLVLAHGATDRAASTPDGDADRIDPVEMLSIVAAIAALVGVLSLGRTWGWTSWRLIAIAALAVTLAVAAFLRNASTDSPMIDPALWRRPGFAKANVLNAVASGAAFAIWLLVPTLLVDEAGVAVIAAGLVLAVAPAWSALSSWWVGQRVDADDSNQYVRIGLFMQAGGMAVLGVAGSGGSLAVVIAGLTLLGAGLGVFVVPNMHHVMAALPIERQGVAGGLALMMRTVGVVIGVAIASAVFDSIERSSGFADAFRAVFVASAVVLAFAAFAAGQARG